MPVVEGGQVVGVGIAHGLAGSAGRFGFMVSAQGLDAGLQYAAQRLLHQVARDEGGSIDRALLFAAASHTWLTVLGSADILVRFGGRTTLGGQESPPSVARLQALTQSLQAGNRLPEDVAQYVHVNHRADRGAFAGVGDLAHRTVIVIAQFLEMSAHFVGHLERLQRFIPGEEAAVVSGDIQAGIAFVNGAQQAPEVVPDGVST